MSGQEGKIVANDQPANLVCSHHFRFWHIAAFSSIIGCQEAEVQIFSCRPKFPLRTSLLCWFFMRGIVAVKPGVLSRRESMSDHRAIIITPTVDEVCHDAQ